MQSLTTRLIFIAVLALASTTATLALPDSDGDKGSIGSTHTPTRLGTPFPTPGPPDDSPYDLLVNALHGGFIAGFDYPDWTPFQFANVPNSPLQMAFGLDGIVYVLEGFGDLGRFDGQSGGSIGSIQLPQTDASPTDIAVAPDGNIYFPSGQQGAIYRYEPSTVGTPQVILPAPGFSGDNIEHIAVGKDGNIYCSVRSGNILRYSRRSGEFMGVFVQAGSGGLQGRARMAFGLDGDLFTPNGRRILRFDGDTGEFIEEFVNHDLGGGIFLLGLTFGPDGDLYAAYADGSNSNFGGVVRFSGETGDFIELIPPAGSGGPLMQTPVDPVFVPRSNPPSTPNIEIFPRDPITTDDLVCTANGSIDPEGEPVSYLVPVVERPKSVVSRG